MQSSSYECIIQSMSFEIYTCCAGVPNKAHSACNLHCSPNKSDGPIISTDLNTARPWALQPKCCLHIHAVLPALPGFCQGGVLKQHGRGGRETSATEPEKEKGKEKSKGPSLGMLEGKKKKQQNNRMRRRKVAAVLGDGGKR